MEEIWVNIIGFKLYQVSNLGRVKSLRNNKILSQTIIFGYHLVRLTENSISKQHRVHRLVAEAFIPNPEFKETVNHEDGNKSNNNVNNLRWATQLENNVHAYQNGLNKGAIKKCFQYSLQFDLLRCFSSVKEAERLIGVSGVAQACHKHISTAGGYYWRHIEI